MADWLRDRGRDEDAEFRGALPGWITERSRAGPAEWEPTGWLQQHGRTGRDRYQIRTNRQIGSGPGGTYGYPVVSEPLYVWSNQDPIWSALEGYHPAGPEDPNLPDDPEFWRARRTPDVGAHDITPAERAMTGIDQLGNIDPAIWPQLEALLRERHDRGQRLSRYSRTDYGFGPTHSDFHRAILAEPGNETHAGAYADWLEEQGQPTAAEVIRRHVAELKNWNATTKDGGNGAELAGFQEDGLVRDYGRPVGRFVVDTGGYPDGHTRIRLMRHEPDRPHGVWWGIDEPDPDLADAIAERLFAEGAVPSAESFHQPATAEGTAPQQHDHLFRRDAHKKRMGMNRSRYEFASSPAVTYDLGKEVPMNYSHDAFKAAIHASPHDETNQLVYADWLDDQGPEFQKEAAERRKLAAWMQKHREGTGKPIRIRPYDHSDVYAAVYPASESSDPNGVEEGPWTGFGVDYYGIDHYDLDSNGRPDLMDESYHKDPYEALLEARAWR